MPEPRRRNPGRLAENADDGRYAELAARCKSAYRRERITFESLRLGEPVEYEPGAAFDGRPEVRDENTGRLTQRAVESAWIRLAKFFVKNKIDYKLYIAAQFSRLGLSDRAPAPTHLIGDKSMYCWRRAIEGKGEEIRLALEIQKSIAKRRICFLQSMARRTPDESVAMTLNDTGLELSALFRYCLASSMRGDNFRKIADRFEADAAMQFARFETHYENHWSAFLPEGFPERAVALYELMYEARCDGESEK